MPESPTTISGHVLEYLKGTAFNNQLILLLIGIIGGLGYYTLHSVLPMERQAIEQMADRIETQHTKQIETVANSFEKTLDRIQATRPGIAAAPPQ